MVLTVIFFALDIPCLYGSESDDYLSKYDVQNVELIESLEKPLCYVDRTGMPFIIKGFFRGFVSVPYSEGIDKITEVSVFKSFNSHPLCKTLLEKLQENTSYEIGDPTYLGIDSENGSEKPRKEKIDQIHSVLQTVFSGARCQYAGAVRLAEKE